VKKATHTIGVQRQYTGTAGRIENAQVAVYLIDAGVRGHAAADRCRAAGLGEDTVFAASDPRRRTHRSSLTRRAHPAHLHEIQRLFTMPAVQPVHDVAHWLAWSAWRRRHQARAQASHYRRQAANQT
jgi:hypothetical protein